MAAECLFLIVSVNVGITLCNYLYQAQQDNIVAFSINLCKYMYHAQASRSILSMSPRTQQKRMLANEIWHLQMLYSNHWTSQISDLRFGFS